MLPRLDPLYDYKYDDSVVFWQRATNTKIRGRESLQQSGKQWECDFCTAVMGSSNDDLNNVLMDDKHDKGTIVIDRQGIRMQTSTMMMTSPSTLLVQWNVTYVDPSVQWMLTLADWAGWKPTFQGYTDRTGEVRTFSYRALVRLFATAIETGKLCIPLACIEGTWTCNVYERNDDKDETRSNTPAKRKKRIMIQSIVEDLSYAQEIKRGVLLNRLCARDLQFFLETARKPLEYNDDQKWQDHVAMCLPWRSVPGMMDPLYIQEQSMEQDGIAVPLGFVTFTLVVLVLFANLIAAPNLIGQSLPPLW